MPLPYPVPQPQPDPDGRPGPHDPPGPKPPPGAPPPPLPPTSHTDDELPPNLRYSPTFGMHAWQPEERVTRTFANAPMLGDAGFIRTGGRSLR